ncbi:MAG TPA: hypothetical protein VH054_12950, partial [Polyangiaceae bacterium]|nr:hypothetical protein [Polyangiaceae bacterium]
MKQSGEIRAGVWAALVVVCSICAFAVPIDGPWIFDDLALISGNRFVHDPSLWHHWFTSHLWDTNYHPGAQPTLTFWRPAVLATFALDWRLGHGNPFVFHVTNLVLHAATSWLAFRTLARWSRSPVAAFVGAMFFALHPTKAESVAWIAGRPDILCAAGIFVAIWGVAMRLEGRRSGILLEIAGASLAYLAKEQAVVLPLFVIVEAWAVDRAWNLRTTLRAAAPHVLAALVYLAARHLWLPIGHASDPIPLTSHAAYVLESFARYIVLTFWPSDLSFGRAQISFVGLHPAPSGALVALGAISLVAVGAAAWTCRKRAPGVTV